MVPVGRATVQARGYNHVIPTEFWSWSDGTRCQSLRRSSGTTTRNDLSCLPPPLCVGAAGGPEGNNGLAAVEGQWLAHSQLERSRIAEEGEDDRLVANLGALNHAFSGVNR